MNHSKNITNTNTFTPPYYNDLSASLAHAWACLARGSADRRSPFHAPVVASVGIDGTPEQRTMILRKVDVPTRTLRFLPTGVQQKLPIGNTTKV
ncbi:MAG: hypothetical protein HC782_02435 [Gammaproteobacteria bacterium]|nr:hypothetical protein [Gammaproteobacteria bacterium]